MNNFSLSSSNQAESIEYFLKAALYKNLHQDCFLGLALGPLLVGVLDGVMTITKRVALIAENIFKGALNILGAPFFSSCKISRGVRQLIGGTLKNLAFLPFSVLSAGVNLCIIPIRMAMDSTFFTLNKWHDHDPVAKRDFYMIEWDDAVNTYKNNPNDLNAIKYIAKTYDKGNPVWSKNLTEAVKFYTHAADLNDVESQVYLAHYYMNLENYDESFKYSKLAYQNQSIDGTTILGVHYASGFGVDKDYDIAFGLFTNASKQGSCEAFHFLGTAYAKGSGVQKIM